jgi:hypothetical protein
MRALGIALVVFGPLYAVGAWIYAGIPHGSTQVIECAGVMLLAASSFVFGILLIQEGR